MQNPFISPSQLVKLRRHPFVEYKFLPAPDHLSQFANLIWISVFSMESIQVACPCCQRRKCHKVQKIRNFPLLETTNNVEHISAHEDKLDKKGKCLKSWGQWPPMEREVQKVWKAQIRPQFRCKLLEDHNSLTHRRVWKSQKDQNGILIWILSW